MDYYLIAAGVNQSPGQTVLNFAEKDAKDIHDLMVSAVGPDPRSILLRGNEADRPGISAAFLGAMLARTFWCFTSPVTATRMGSPSVTGNFIMLTSST